MRRWVQAEQEPDKPEVSVSTTIQVLGDMLFRPYIIDFIANMQMGVSTLYDTVEEDTNFGVLLHKEDLWSLYQFREEKSLLYHLCRSDYGRFELVNNPCQPSSGECIRCRAEAPQEIHGLWKLHNFEWIQSNGGEHV